MSAFLDLSGLLISNESIKIGEYSLKEYLSVIPFALVLCLFVGCQKKAAMAELEKFRAQAEIEERNKALFRIIVDAQNNGNIDFFNEYFAPDYAYYFPSNSREPMSLEETREMFETHLISFPDYKWTIEDLFAVKDMVIARINSEGTFTNNYHGIAATGNKAESSTIVIVRIENGKIVEEWKEMGGNEVTVQGQHPPRPTAF